MPTIPTHHNVGDTGHVVDHNSIVDVLSDHDGRITTLQSATSTYVLNTGQNTITVVNPAGYADHVVIPSGTRDSAAYVRTVSYGGKQTFGLDTFGHLRAGPASDTSTPVEVWGNSASQSADLTRWRTAGSAGAIVARVGSDGTLYAPNVTPGAWTNVPLGSGLTAGTTTGFTPSYRVTGDRVEMRGSVSKTDGSNFTTSPVNVGTIPSTVSPVSVMHFICATNIVGNLAWARIDVNPSGSIQAYFASASYSPAWINLDGIDFCIRS